MTGKWNPRIGQRCETRWLKHGTTMFIHHSGNFALGEIITTSTRSTQLGVTIFGTVGRRAAGDGQNIRLLGVEENIISWRRKHHVNGRRKDGRERGRREKERTDKSDRLHSRPHAKVALFAFLRIWYGTNKNFSIRLFVIFSLFCFFRLRGVSKFIALGLAYSAGREDQNKTKSFNHLQFFKNSGV
ncbi:hypothetical protein B0T20DRAFT_103133 [Sordaria brevicollis]|uniref:Uncharacterized protein n=1 Tax=Sordaria brevicollis TaxID=83679 RepID=A0AAE0U2L4_SORBR|nr:hypothetical protein B0T20DRAFT_103133 [Sordaria brevicollis]